MSCALVIKALQNKELEEEIDKHCLILSNLSRLVLNIVRNIRDLHL